MSPLYSSDNWAGRLQVVGKSMQYGKVLEVCNNTNCHKLTCIAFALVQSTMPSFPVPGISQSKRSNKAGVVLQQQQPRGQANDKREGQQALQIFKTRTASCISSFAVVHVLQPIASRKVSDKRYSGHALPVASLLL